MTHIVTDRERRHIKELIINMTTGWTSVFWLASYMSRRCLNYRNSSIIFRLVVELLEEDSCAKELVNAFLDQCGHDLSRWVTPEGRPDSLRLFLDFSCRVKDIAEEKRITIFYPYVPDLVNQNICHLRMANIPLLLRYGLGLEFTEIFYRILQEGVLWNIL